MKELTIFQQNVYKRILNALIEGCIDVPANNLHKRINRYMDSLDEVESIMIIEEEFDIEITDEQAEKIKTLYDATVFVANRLNRSQKEDITKDAMNSLQIGRNESNVNHIEPVITALLKEREYQDTIWNESSTQSKGLHSPTEWLVFIQHYLSTAMTAASTQSEPKASHDVMDNIRKIGAMCMAAMEQNEIVERK